MIFPLFFLIFCSCQILRHFFVADLKSNIDISTIFKLIHLAFGILFFVISENDKATNFIIQFLKIYVHCKFCIQGKKFSRFFIRKDFFFDFSSKFTFFSSSFKTSI